MASLEQPKNIKITKKQENPREIHQEMEKNLVKRSTFNSRIENQ